MEQKNQRKEIPDLNQKLKTLNFSQFYKKGSYLDVFDQGDNTWRVAKVLELSQNYVKITYDGFKSVYDETISINSQKLAPFRSKTMNYTGHKTYARDNVFLNLKSDLEKTIERMQSLEGNQFGVEDPYELTQFLRGELYILIDYCLSKAQHPCDSNLIRNLLEIYIAFFNSFLDVFRMYLKEAIEFRNVSPLMYLVHDKSALVNSYPEMIDTLKKLFGNYERVGKFLQNEGEPKFPSGEIFVKKGKSSLSNQYLYFINLFIVSGGFQKILNLIDWTPFDNPEKDLKKAGSPKIDNTMTFPFLFLRDTYILFKLIFPHLVSPKKEAFAKDLMTKFARRMSLFNTRDIKDLELKDTLYTVQKFHAFFEELMLKESNQYDNDEREMNLIIKFMKSGFLEKQLKAIDEIKRLIFLSDSSNDFNEENNENYGSKKGYFTQPDKLRNFIIKNRIIEYILGEDFHVEILKRAKMVFRFLAQTGGISKEHFDLLWKLSGDIHDNNKKTVYETLIELSRFLNSDNLEYIYEKLKNIPQEKYDETSIELLKEFIINSSKNSKSLSNTFSNLFSKVKTLFGDSKLESPAFASLWKMMLDESKLDNNYTKNCINAIIDIFKKTPSKSEKEKYLELCIENLKRGTSVCQSLILFMSISGTFTASGINYLWKETAYDVLAKWSKNYSLINLVIQNLEKFVAEFNKYSSKTLNNDSKLQNRIIQGKYTYRENLETRLNFITNISICSNKKNELTIEHMKKMWNVFMKSKQNSEQTIFIAWLLREKSEKDSKSNNKKSFLLPDSLITDIFNMIFIDPNLVEVATMTLEVFKCFQTFFEYINLQTKTLELNHKGQIRVLRFNSILGKDYFWHIMVYNKNEQILNICKTSLLNIYIRLSNDNYKPEDRLPIWKEFISNSINSITNKEISQSNLSFTAMTLKTFLNMSTDYLLSFLPF